LRKKRVELLIETAQRMRGLCHQRFRGRGPERMLYAVRSGEDRHHHIPRARIHQIQRGAGTRIDHAAHLRWKSEGIAAGGFAELFGIDNVVDPLRQRS
jgi:hypothetical protein